MRIWFQVPCIRSLKYAYLQKQSKRLNRLAKFRMSSIVLSSSKLPAFLLSQVQDLVKRKGECTFFLFFSLFFLFLDVICFLAFFFRCLLICLGGELKESLFTLLVGCLYTISHTHTHTNVLLKATHQTYSTWLTLVRWGKGKKKEFRI